jgi:hypothetical protein
VRTDRVAEEGLVRAGVQPVAAGVLLVAEASGQVAGVRDLVEHDRAVAEARADQRAAVTAEGVEHRVEPGGLDHQRLAGIHGGFPLSARSPCKGDATCGAASKRPKRPEARRDFPAAAEGPEKLATPASPPR